MSFVAMLVCWTPLSVQELPVDYSVKNADSFTWRIGGQQKVDLLASHRSASQSADQDVSDVLGFDEFRILHAAQHSSRDSLFELVCG